MSPAAQSPIYQRLNRALRDLARGGEFCRGEQFLTERQISERFDVSRPTANKAVASLVAEGLLEIRKGIGTFVRGEALGYDLRALVSFTEKVLAAGKQPETRVLEFRRLRSADLDIAVRKRLALVAGEDVVYMQRLRLVDRAPVILERRYVPAELCPRLKKTAAAGSLYHFLSATCGLRVLGADEVVRAVNVSAGDARLIKMVKGAAGLLVSRVGYLESGRPLWWEQTLYRGDAYEFHNVLGGAYPARPGALLPTSKG
jgi:GntR family transcriptional regulator